MKNIFLFIFIFISYISINAQTKYEDVVYLKNGSIIHGIIIEQIPNESIKIKSGQNIFVYKISEVQKMKKEEVINEPNKEIKNKNITDFLGTWIIRSKFDGPFGKKGSIINQISISVNSSTYFVNIIDKNNSMNTKDIANIVGKFLIIKDGGYAPGEIKMFILDNGNLYFDGKEYSKLSNEINNQTEQNNSDVNSTTNFPYNQIEKKSYFVDNLPNFKNANIELAKIESLTTNFNVSEVQDVIKRAFENSSRFESNPRDKSVTNFSYEFTITSLNYTFDQGKKAVSNEPFSGYSCKILLKYKLINKTNNSTIYEETLTFEGGDPKLDTDKSNAYNLCLKRLSKTISNLILFYSPVLSNFESVESSDKKGFPKFIYLDNSKYFSSDMNIFFVLVEESNIYYKGGKLTYSNAIATCDLKGINDNKLKCKILSGEEKLKSYIDNGKKIVAVSSIIKPEKVE